VTNDTARSTTNKSHGGASGAGNGSGVSEYAGANYWLIAILVSVATFMEVLDTTIANVVLRYIAGGLAVSPDEASWVVTSYLVANSIVLCASSWLVKLFGRKRFFMICIALFSLSSLLCGMAWDLQSLLIFRVMQGLAGGGMTPVAQSILAAAFPPEKRTQGFAIYGIAVVVAPAVGPALGGWLADTYSWHWCFLINVPVGIASLASVALLLPASKKEDNERRKLWKKGLSFDAVGFILVATFLGALEVVLDKGQEDDWFGSQFISGFAISSAVALVLFVPWELLRKEPLIDLRMLVGRQFGTCFLVMLGTGAIMIATVQFLPQLLQTDYGYTATLSGMAVSPGGAVTMVMMFVVGRLGWIQPKYLIAIGGVIVALGMYDLTSIYGDLTFGFFAWSRVYVGIGLPFLFIPVTAASYSGLPPDKTDQASALINVARNFGGSIGVSMAQTVLARREQVHQSNLVHHVGAWNPIYTQTLNQVRGYFATRPLGGPSVSQTSAAWIGQQVEIQASLLAYIDVFFMLLLVAVAVAVLALTLRTVAPGPAVQGAD
jgi:MFS transporter, DHA2 family, multidrug resistance protein